MSEKRNPFYEKEFPSLSDVQGKNNTSNKNLSSQDDNVFSYSARLKTSSIEKKSNNVNIEERKCSSAPFSLKTRTFNQNCGTQTENVQPNMDSFSLSKNENLSNKIYKRPSYNEINCESTKCNSNTHIKSFGYSDKEVENTTSEEGWTTVRKKLPPTDQTAQSGNKQKLFKPEFKNNSPKLAAVGVSNERYKSQNVGFQKTSVGRYSVNGNSNAKVDGTNENKPLQSGYAKSNGGNSKHSNRNFSVQGQKDYRLKQSNFKPREKDGKSRASQHSSESNFKIASSEKNSGSDFHKNNSNYKSHCNKNQSTKIMHEKRTENYSFRDLNEERVTEKNVAQVQFSGSSKAYPQNNLKQNTGVQQSSKNLYSQVSGVKIARDAEFKNSVSTNANSSNKKFCANQSHSSLNPSNKKLNSSRKENNNKSINNADVANLNSIGTSKKKRKSKVKRQTAMQSDKIRIITPEVHSKILNLSNKESVQLQKNLTVNINDCFEYPELGANVIQKSNSENVMSKGGISFKKDISDPSKKYLKVEKDALNFTISESTKEVSFTPKGIGKTIELSENEDECPEKEKLPVHFNEPITISLFDMLLAKKTKKKEPEKYNVPMGNSIHKTSMKKQLPLFSNRQVVNPLDSSKPAIKRGKEREKPKPKRPSQLKKIVLMDRKRRKEQILAQSISKESQSTVEKGDSTNFKFSFILNSVESINESMGCAVIQPDMPSDIFNLEENASELKVPEKIPLNVDNNVQIFSALAETNGNCDQIIDSNSGTDADMHVTKFGGIIKENTDSQNSKESPLIDFKTNSFTIKLEIVTDNVELSQNYKHSECDSKVIYNECTLEEQKRTNPNTIKEENIFNKFSTEQQLIPQNESKNAKVIVESSESDFDNNLQNSCNFLTSNQQFGFYEKCFHSVPKMTCIECSQNQKDIYVETVAISKPLFKIKNKTSPGKKLKTRTVEHGLSDIRYLFQDVDTLKIHFSEEFICDEFLTDIQHLFTDKNNSECLFDNYFPTITDNTNLTFQEKNNILVNNKYNINEVSSQLAKTILENNKNCFEETETEVCKEDISIYELQNSAEDSIKSDFKRRYSDQEILAASLIVLHSKKFREYCTHFLSKSLEDSVFILLDDLARFQDRMHQKDPVKARMKRRLLYGIREIKRHMKLKKLKCIIVATDIEDSKTEGGLNDLLQDLMSLAKDYQIPCIFSHLRRQLGKVCRKPAPVSAVGIFNYEGSEVNFKKMIELQNECKIDYAQVLRCLILMLTDEQIDSLYKTKKENMSNLHNITTTLLRLYFPKPGETISKISNINPNSGAKNLGLSSYSDLNTLNINSNILSTKQTPVIGKMQQNVLDAEEASHVYNILLKYKIVNY